MSGSSAANAWNYLSFVHVCVLACFLFVHSAESRVVVGFYLEPREKFLRWHTR